MWKLIAISGSLRLDSTNTQLLDAVARLAPPMFEVEIAPTLAELPHFDAPADDDGPAIVAAFRATVRAADAVIIASPEYAHGIPGSLKNALDWMVGSGELYERPVLLLHGSPRATFAQAALIEVLRTMGAVIVGDTHFPIELLGSRADADRKSVV